jgi:serine/threonine protein kinase
VDGTPFGRYRLVELLGRGGMGEVWRAHDTATDRVVALKVLPAKFADDQIFQERFRREARAAAGLDEPHVVPIYDFGEIEGRFFVTMRLIRGHDLQVLLEGGPLEPGRAVGITEQIASALHAAHDIELVHRDVKPSNILVAQEDFTYLIDFGIARAAGETGLTSTGATIGTWAYMAPERLNTGHADASADIYALACVLHEALTGQRPYPGDSLEQQVVGHLTTPPPRPSTLQPGVPEAMDSVIATGMAKDPEQRYATTKELSQAARAALTTPRPRPGTTAQATAPANNVAATLPADLSRTVHLDDQPHPPGSTFISAPTQRRPPHGVPTQRREPPDYRPPPRRLSKTEQRWWLRNPLATQIISIAIITVVTGVTLPIIYYPVSAIVWIWYKGFSFILGPSNFYAWALSVMFLVFTLRAVLPIPLILQTRAMRAIQEPHPEDGPNPILGRLLMLAQVPVFLGLCHVLRSFNRTQGGFGQRHLSVIQNRLTGNYIFSPLEVQHFLDANLFGAPIGASMTQRSGLEAFSDFSRPAVIAIGVPVMILAGLATYFNSRASVARQSTEAAANPQTAMMNKLALYVLPLTVVLGGPLLPLAIILYLFANNIWTFGQHRFLFAKTTTEDRIKG